MKSKLSEGRWKSSYYYFDSGELISLIILRLKICSHGKAVKMEKVGSLIPAADSVLLKTPD
jgi:hypothetical protein